MMVNRTTEVEILSRFFYKYFSAGCLLFFYLTCLILHVRLLGIACGIPLLLVLTVPDNLTSVGELAFLPSYLNVIRNAFGFTESQYVHYFPHDKSVCLKHFIIFMLPWL